MIKITNLTIAISVAIGYLFKLLFKNKKSITRLVSETNKTDTFVSPKNQKLKIRKWKKSKIKKHKK